MASIFPSLISGDLLNLGDQIKRLDPYVAGFHLDIMDNHFVPNLTWGPAFIDAIAKATDRILWVHFMVDNPGTWIKNIKLPKQSIVSFHIETNDDIKNLISFIEEKGWRPSLALSPKTPVEKILPFLGSVHQALVMSVEPGHSGQRFLPEMMVKVQELAKLRHEKKLTFSIGIDGGISEQNIAQLAQLGVDDFAIATGIFGKPDPVLAVQQLDALIK